MYNEQPRLIHGIGPFEGEGAFLSWSMNVDDIDNINIV